MEKPHTCAHLHTQSIKQGGAKCECTCRLWGAPSSSFCCPILRVSSSHANVWHRDCRVLRVVIRSSHACACAA